MDINMEIFSSLGLPKKILPCFHPEHNPPMHMVYPPGEHYCICPSCGHVITFEVPYTMF